MDGKTRCYVFTAVGKLIWKTFPILLLRIPESMHYHSSLQNWKRIIQTVLGFSGVWASCAIAGIATLATPLPWFQVMCFH